MLIDKSALSRALGICIILVGIAEIGGCMFGYLTKLGISQGVRYAAMIAATILPFVSLWPTPSRISVKPLHFYTRIIIFFETLMIFLCLSLLSKYFISSESYSISYNLAVFFIVFLCFLVYSTKSLVRESNLSKKT